MENVPTVSLVGIIELPIVSRGQFLQVLDLSDKKQLLLKCDDGYDRVEVFVVTYALPVVPKPEYLDNHSTSDEERRISLESDSLALEVSNLHEQLHYVNERAIQIDLDLDQLRIGRKHESSRPRINKTKPVVGRRGINPL